MLPSFTGINICKLNILHAIEGSKKKKILKRHGEWLYITHRSYIMDFSYAAKNYWGENTCTYNEYMHIAQALRTLFIEDKKSICRFYGSRLPNYQSETINFQ